MAFPVNPMAKKVLLVEGNDEKGLCSLLINKKLGLKYIIGKYDKPLNKKI